MDERPLRWGEPPEYHRLHWPPAKPVLAASAAFGGSGGGPTLKSGAPTLCSRIHAILDARLSCENAFQEVQVRKNRKNRKKSHFSTPVGLTLYQVRF